MKKFALLAAGCLAAAEILALPPSIDPFVVVLAISLANGTQAASPRASPDPGLVDFGTPPLFSFLGWEKKPRIEDGAVRLQAPDAKGGFGYNVALDLSTSADRTPAVAVTVWPANRVKTLKIILKDADGTSHEYAFLLQGIAAGLPSTLTAADGASLKEPGNVGDAGKQAGFDLARVTQVIVVGDWSEEVVDVSIRCLLMAEPTAEILAARERLRERLALEAEERRQAEEARERRRREILAGAPHPPDGPDVRHVGPVAPDILALRLQEKEFVPVPQVPWEPEIGDAVKREGKEEDDRVLVVEGGRVQESLLEVAVYRKDGGRESKLGNLAVNARRVKPEDRVTGQDLTIETVDAPEAYRVAGVDDPDWREPATPEMVWWKRKPNVFRSMAFEVQIFLKLPRPLAEGKRYRLEFPGVNLRQASIEYLHSPSRTRSAAVHVSAIGFRPDDPFKRALLSVWLGTGGAHAFGSDLRFQLLEDATGKRVFSGPVRPLKGADEAESFKDGRNYAKTDVLAMDFGPFRTPGRYRVFVEGIGCSYPFDIADEVWMRAFRLSMKGLLNQRSGMELGPPFTDYLRPRNMHPADGAKVFASEGSEIEGGGQDGIFRMLANRRTDRLLPDAWGGHMDAGDWDRNSQHPAALWLLVDLYELFPERIGELRLALPAVEAENRIPDILDEVLWNLDLYRRLQTPDGGVGGGIESTSHPRPGEASWQESLYISAYAPDPRSSFIHAATAAKLARALDGIDERLSATYAASSRKAWDWARSNEERFLGLAGGKERPSMAEEFRDRRNLAAFELWRLTGEPAFHDAFKASTRLSDPDGEIARQSRAATSYARLPNGQGDAALRNAARRWVVQAADASLAFADGNSFGISVPIPTLPPMGFVGYFSTPETILGPILPHAWLLTRDPKYLAGAVRACQFSAGANPDNRALTTRLGPDPVRFPLHIDSWVTGQPAPAGITVYGISDPAENYSFDGWAHTWFLQKMVPGSRSWPAHESYWDIYVVPSTNEFTIHQTMIPTAFYWGFLAARP